MGGLLHRSDQLGRLRIGCVRQLAASLQEARDTGTPGTATEMTGRRNAVVPRTFERFLKLLPYRTHINISQVNSLRPTDTTGHEM